MTDRPKTGQPRTRPVTGGGSVVAGSRPATGGGAAGGRPPTGGVGSRRAARRAPYVAPVRIIAGPRVIDGRVENLSEGGMMLTLPVGLQERESVISRFALPMTHTLVSVPATVVWQLPSRPGFEVVGLEFALVDETMRREVQRYIELVGPPDEGP